jgi:hypothetical protein
VEARIVVLDKGRDGVPPAKPVDKNTLPFGLSRTASPPLGANETEGGGPDRDLPVDVSQNRNPLPPSAARTAPSELNSIPAGAPLPRIILNDFPVVALRTRIAPSPVASNLPSGLKAGNPPRSRYTTRGRRLLTDHTVVLGELTTRRREFGLNESGVYAA